MFEVSLDSSWPKDSPSCEAPGFPEPAGPEIRKNRKNVFDKYFLHPKNLVQQKVVWHLIEIGVRSQVSWGLAGQTNEFLNFSIFLAHFLKSLSFELHWERNVSTTIKISIILLLYVIILLLTQHSSVTC